MDLRFRKARGAQCLSCGRRAGVFPRRNCARREGFPARQELYRWAVRANGIAQRRRPQASCVLRDIDNEWLDDKVTGDVALGKGEARLRFFAAGKNNRLV